MLEKELHIPTPPPNCNMYLPLDFSQSSPWVFICTGERSTTRIWLVKLATDPEFTVFPVSPGRIWVYVIKMMITTTLSVF